MRPFGVLALMLLVAACAWVAPHAPPQPAGADVLLVPMGFKVPAPHPPGTLSRVVAVEVVSKDADRHRGLSGRKVLGPDAGMLFVYRHDQVRNFWMKDTYIALDIAYIRADGTVAKVATLPPGADALPGQVPQESSVEPVRYVLEVEAGWFARRGLGTGARVDVAGVTAGVVPD